ncbi:hypothetical protein B0I72DRAFT_107937 [Yarrowia lipolytica]|uniref:YALI0E10527p n=2 Tax=Yarrowia lipolytica TaxID=4952 RepID=Q6C6C8_YARLI|eukprot:XP_503784.1 YALI0E10527p [Yarrowia lipolytica CLIB122]
MASQRTIDPSHLLVFSHSAATRSTSPPSSKLRSDCPMIYLSDCRSAVSHTHSQLFHPVPGAFFLQLPTDETVFLADALHGSASGARVTMTGSSHVNGARTLDLVSDECKVQHVQESMYCGRPLHSPHSTQNRTSINMQGRAIISSRNKQSIRRSHCLQTRVVVSRYKAQVRYNVNIKKGKSTEWIIFRMPRFGP